ncbi:MAG TPA: hypothetical protein VM939_09285, partial [Gemmatimonadaceae bacterium]|nr:hypothetical protein [Gemmatimonadaceae bacterium]
LAREGIVRRAADLEFRFTKDPGGRGERREDRRASIVVTNQSVLIHKNDRIGLHITPRTRRAVAVERSGSRVRIRWGSGRSEEVWSFDAPDDAAGWTQDMRKVLTPENTANGKRTR